MCLCKLNAEILIWESSLLHIEADGNEKWGPLKSLRETFFVTEQVLWKHKKNTENGFAF